MSENIFDRITYMAEKEADNIPDFSRKIGFGDQTLRGMLTKRVSFPSYKVIEAICRTFPKYDANWLITGVGNPLRINNVYEIEEDKLTEVNESANTYNKRNVLNNKDIEGLIQTNLVLAECVKEQMQLISEIKNLFDQTINK